jgi:hypothetical protein
MVRSVVAGVGIAMSLCCGALAQDTSGLSDAAKSVIGAWELSNADRDRVCRITFQTDAVPGGYRADLDRNCANLFPSTKDVAGWTMDKFGTLRLLDAQGNALLELTEVESGIFDGFQPGEGRYVLQSAAAAPIRSADDMIGDWAVARGAGKPICRLTLAGSPAAAGTLALNIKPGCDALIARFGPTAWRMERGELVLLSAHGQSWRFEENDANTWLRVPQSADPVLLVRQ